MSRTERDRFLEASVKADRMTRTFCLCLAFTGCRISEAIELTANRVDLAERTDVHRAVPVPANVTNAMDLVHVIRERQKSKRAIVSI